MTWYELVKKYFPDASDLEVEFILWEKTACPIACVSTVERQLQEYKKELEDRDRGGKDE